MLASFFLAIQKTNVLLRLFGKIKFPKLSIVKETTISTRGLSNEENVFNP